jgi:dihydroxy-acid dehydratase
LFVNQEHPEEKPCQPNEFANFVAHSEPCRFLAPVVRYLRCDKRITYPPEGGTYCRQEALEVLVMANEPHGFDRGLTNYGDFDFARFLRRSFARSMGISCELLNKPIVGIAMTPSGFNNCHRYVPELVEAVSRGVLAAGALPRPFPTVSLGEVFLNPTSMMYRNLMAMDTEEMIVAQPMDAVVLIGGCDKTVPAQLMGAASAGLPAIQVVTGPMSTGRHKGQRLGACTDCRGFWAKYRAGSVDSDEINTVEGRLSVTAGTCAVMGTASTMACIAEALGMSLPGTAAIPAVHSDRLVAAEETGKAAVRLIETKITPRDIITQKSVENAIRVLMALSGSTNAIVHLTAVAGRLGIPIPYKRFNQISDETPVLIDLKPVGEGYMEDFHAAGGMGALLRELRPLLHLDTIDVEGRTLRERLDEPEGWIDRKIIRPFSNPISPVGGLVALGGSLAPDGAIFKRAAATPALFESEGRAVVFTGLEDLSNRIDDPNLDVKEGDILVLQNAGPHAAGMPEAGYLPIPKKLAQAGVKDMVRISDARMSGTAFGSIVLHVAPESAIGGPLAAVRNGDRIRLSIKDKRVDLLVESSEISRRLQNFQPPPAPARGYKALYRRTVTQAPEGCDFNFLLGDPA